MDEVIILLQKIIVDADKLSDKFGKRNISESTFSEKYERWEKRCIEFLNKYISNDESGKFEYKGRRIDINGNLLSAEKRDAHSMWNELLFKIEYFKALKEDYKKYPEIWGKKYRVLRDVGKGGEPSKEPKEENFEKIQKKLAKKIFIGHGGSKQWRDLKDHLQDKHNYEIVEYSIVARPGQTTKEILEKMLVESSFAILVMIGEDVDASGKLHARENVVHEIGLFQGRLGFERTFILLEEGVEEFSNITGIHQIRFSKGNIKETFGEVVATIKKLVD